MNNKKQDISNFFSGVALCILGERSSMKLRGTPDKVGITQQVIVASRNLLEALEHPQTTLPEIKALLETKKEKAQEFKGKTGVTWIL